MFAPSVLTSGNTGEDDALNGQNETSPSPKFPVFSTPLTFVDMTDLVLPVTPTTVLLQYLAVFGDTVLLALCLGGALVAGEGGGGGGQGGGRAGGGEQEAQGEQEQGVAVVGHGDHGLTLLLQRYILTNFLCLFSEKCENIG